MFVSILAFVFVLGIVVVVHEAGHFLAARALKAPVEVFSVGFGKRLWGFERGGTDYRLSLFPLGGYVRIVGLGPDESMIDDAEDVELLPRWKRALILLAGPITNVVAAIFFLAVAFLIGVETPAYFEQAPVAGWVEPDSPADQAGILPGDLVVAVNGARIASWRDLQMSLGTAGGRLLEVEIQRDGRDSSVALTPEKITRYDFGYSGLAPQLDATVIRLQAGSPAEGAGLRPGDRITAVDGEAVRHFYDLIRLISPRPDQEVTLTLTREGDTIALPITPRDVGGEGKIGIPVVFPTEMRQLNPIAAVAAASQECVRMTRDTFKILGKLVTRRTSIKQVSGPVEIARFSGEAVRGGLRSLIWFLGLISLQLGIFNLLPIPILDGGHLTILAFESAIRRDLSLKLKERILEVGLVLLLLLTVVVMYNDIMKNIPESLYRLLHRS